jgi:hypothetical protein
LFLWKSLERIFSGTYGRLVSGIFYGLAILMIAHNLFSVNFNSFYLWKYDTNTKKVMNIIKQKIREGKPALGKKYKILTTFLYEPSTIYYILVDKIPHAELTSEKGPDDLFDFYYIDESVLPIIKNYNLKIIKSFDGPRSYLAVP